MEFVLVTDVGPELLADGVDGGLIEAACAIGNGVWQRLAQRNGTGTASSGIFVVEKSVRHCVDELVRKLRRHGAIYGKAGDGTAIDATQDIEETFDVHCFRERVFHDFADERMVRDFDVPGHRLGTS